MAYGEKIIDHYQNPRNVGSLDRNSPNVGTGIVGAPECGDVMKLQIEVSEDGRISLLIAGADVIIMRHPEAIKTVRKVIDSLKG